MPTEQELSDLLDLADEIGERVARGDLPKKDHNGFYVFDFQPVPPKPIAHRKSRRNN